MKRSILLLTLLMVFAAGCKDQKKKNIETTWAKMKSQPIDLCLDKMVCRYENRDTCVSDKQCYSYKMIIYMDSMECSPCRISDLYQWNDFIDNKSPKTKFYFIFSIKKEDIVNSYLALSDADFHYYVYFDTCQAFEKNNKIIPPKRQYHTFLTNAKNEIIMVGNPVENSDIKDLFYKITSK